jgi:L-iditol 2-dehydrogenase
VLATDLLESRLKLAKKFGAKWITHANELKIKIALDAAIIAVPSDVAVKQAMQIVRGAGQVLLFAHTKRGDKLEIDPAAICFDEKDLMGSYSSDFTIQKEVARLVFSRQLDVRKLITHHFPLAKTADAIALAAKPTEASLKILVDAK